jgi:hypothetical protein
MSDTSPGLAPGKVHETPSAVFRIRVVREIDRNEGCRPVLRRPKQTFCKIKGALIEFVTKLRELLITYHNTFRLHLGQNLPTDIRPLKIELKPDAKLKRIPALKYAPPQAQSLASNMADMKRLGLVKKNLASR